MRSTSTAGYIFCCCFLFICNDFCQNNYLKIYQTVFGKFQGRQNVAVDDQCEMFFDLSRDVSMATNFVDFIHILRRCFFCGFIYRTDLLDAMWPLAQPGGLTLGLSGI